MPKRLRFAFLLMGFTSLVVQTLLIREFLITFHGNELTIGLILANWILLEAIGSAAVSRYSAKMRRPVLSYAALQAGIAIYLPIAVMLIRNVKNIAGLTIGEGASLLFIFLSSFMVMAPLSLFDGAQFPFGCRVLSDARPKEGNPAARVYVLEAAGFILAGPVFTYILITNFNSFIITSFLGLLNIWSAILLVRDRLSDRPGRVLFALITISAIALVASFFGPDAMLHKSTIDSQWRGQKVLEYINSIYGNLVATQAADQYTFYSNGIPVIASPVPDTASCEELVHFAMLGHPEAKDVLILGGDSGGVISEVLKYPVKNVTYAELDPSLINLVKRFPKDLTEKEFRDPRLNIIFIDGARFVISTKEKFDVVIENLPPPSTLQLNRFYSLEFFKNISKVLRPDGRLAFSLPGSLSYISPELARLNGSVLATLKSVFYAQVIPGYRNIFIASNRPFTLQSDDMDKELEAKKIPVRLLNSAYLKERLDPEWRRWFYKSISRYGRVRPNRDMLPSGTFYTIEYRNALFSKGSQSFFAALDKIRTKNAAYFILWLGVILLILKRFSRFSNIPVGFAILSTGFMGMGLNLILIYAYQAYYGYVFNNIALLVTSFMAGLALGSAVMARDRFSKRPAYSALATVELLSVVFCIILAAALSYTGAAKMQKLSGIFYVFSLISGSLVGFEFPLANRIISGKGSQSRSGGMLYALDLAGAWLAAIVVSIALVPVIGMIKTCILLVVLKGMSFILVTSRR